MMLYSQTIETIIPIKVRACASIDCSESEYEIEIEKFNFHAQIENGAVVERSTLIFTLSSMFNANERAMIELDYTENYASINSMLSSRDNDKSGHIEIAEIEAASESRKAYLRTIAEELTNVNIIIEIDD